MARNRGLSGVGVGSGFDALVGLEGFMRGWDFGQSINREKEDKADREQARTDKMTERGRATERFEREKTGWAQQDEDREYTLATREPVADVLEKRKLDMEGKRVGLESNKLGLTKGQREERQAPTDAEVAEDRKLTREQKRATLTHTRAQTSKIAADAQNDSVTNKQLAALDYLERNKAMLQPENLQAIDRAYRAFALEDPKALQPGDLDKVSKAMLPLLDKATEFQGMPIVDSDAKPLYRDGKIVFEIAYKVQKPDGTIVDAQAGPLRKASLDGTDVVYELEEDEAMRLLAGHQLIGRDIQRLIESGAGDPTTAINQLRQAIIERGGKKGADAADSVIPKAAARNLEQRDIQIGDQKIGLQFDKDKGVTDEATVTSGVVMDPTGKPVNVKTLADLKRVLGAPVADVSEARAAAQDAVANVGKTLGVQGGGKAAAPQGKPTLEAFVAAMRKNGSKMSDADLAAYHARTYGN